jgi:hypothetical protein
MYPHQARMFSRNPVIEDSGHPRYRQQVPVECRQIRQGVVELVDILAMTRGVISVQAAMPR